MMKPHHNIMLLLLTVAAVVCSAEQRVLEMAKLTADVGAILYGSEPNRFCGDGLTSLKRWGAADSVELAIGSYGPHAFVLSSRAMPWPASVSLHDVAGAGQGFDVDAVTIANLTISQIASAGDVNHDGWEDLIVTTAYQNQNGAAYCIVPASSWLLFGGAHLSKLPGNVAALAELADGTRGVHIVNAANEHCSWSSRGTGDVNGDGIDDFFVGDFSYPTRHAWIIFGSSSRKWTAEVEVSKLAADGGFEIDADLVSKMFAYSADPGPKDVNGDGVADILFSGNNGASFVFFGKKGLTASDITIGKLDGTNGFKINNKTSVLQSLGDANGDGINDICAVAGSDVFVIFGRKSAWPALVDLNALDGSNGFHMLSPETDGSCSCAGVDLNGDGLADIAVGAPDAMVGKKLTGRAFLVYGRRGAWPARLVLEDMETETGFLMNGEAQGTDTMNEFGGKVADAGDMNKDGVNDLAISAQTAQDDWGRVYLIYGTSSGSSGGGGGGGGDKLAIIIGCSVAGGVVLLGIVVLAVVLGIRSRRRGTSAAENAPLVQ